MFLIKVLLPLPKNRMDSYSFIFNKGFTYMNIATPFDSRVTKHPSFLKNIPWTESPFFEELLEASEYDAQTKEKIRFFSENGYLIINPEIPQFNTYAADIISSLKPIQSKMGSRVQDGWNHCETIRTLASNQTILKWLQILFQRNPIPFQTLNFCKGTEQRTHSDLIHFSSVPQKFMAGVWFALEDVDARNGALHYYPGSHKLPFYDLHDIGMSRSNFRNINNQYAQYEEFVHNLMIKGGFEKRTVEIKKGSALIWAANLFHGGNPIIDKERTRHTQVTHYYFEGCKFFIPLFSDIFQENIAWKKITDVRTGKVIDFVYNDTKVSLPFNARMRFSMEQLQKNFPSFKNGLSKIKKLITK